MICVLMYPPSSSVFFFFFFYGSTTLVGLGHFFSSLSHTQSVELLGRVISPSQGSYLHTEQHKHRINAQRLDALSGIRTLDPSFRASEDSSCSIPRSHCDRHLCIHTHDNFEVISTVNTTAGQRQWYWLPSIVWC
jgi:hypothetical protein